MYSYQTYLLQSFDQLVSYIPDQREIDQPLIMIISVIRGSIGDQMPPHDANHLVVEIKPLIK